MAAEPRTGSQGGIPIAPPVDASLTATDRRSRRAVARTALIVVAAASPIVALGLSFAAYANTDHDYLDLPRVARAADTACGDFTAALAATDGLSDLDRIAAGNAAIDELVADMSELGADTLADDFPAVGWLEDWQSLKVAREEFAEALTAQTGESLVVPETPDGYPITRRMVYAGMSENCDRAVTLAASH